MRAIFGVVGLLVALALVGFLAGKALRTARPAGAAAPPTAAASAPTVREQSQQLQQQVRTDVGKALEAGAARNDEAAEAGK